MPGRWLAHHSSHCLVVGERLRNQAAVATGTWNRRSVVFTEDTQKGRMFLGKDCGIAKVLNAEA